MKQGLLPAVLAATTALVGCAGNYQSMDTIAGEGQKSATIIVAPPDYPVYRQIAHEGSRYIDPDFNAFQEGLLASSASAVGFTIGHYAGYAWAAGGNYTATTATAALPLVGVALVAASAATDSVAKNVKFNNADKAIVGHRLVLDAVEFDSYAEEIIEDSVTEFSYLNVEAVVSAEDLALVKNLGLELSSEMLEAASQTLVSGSVGDIQQAQGETLDSIGSEDFYEFEDLLAEIDTDLAVVVAYFPQFSPMFEVLEIQSVVSVYDSSSEKLEDALYTNAITFQSKHHAGLHSADTRDELPQLLGFYREYLTNVRSRNGAVSLGAHKRADIEEQVKWRGKAMRKRYFTVDEHDPEGQYWLEEGGKPMVNTLKKGLREIVRLAVADINGGCKLETTTKSELEGTNLELNQCSTLSSDGRLVYRDDRGELLSVDEKSRYVLPGPV